MRSIARWPRRTPTSSKSVWSKNALAAVRNAGGEPHLVRRRLLWFVGDIVDQIATELARLVFELGHAGVEAEVISADGVDPADVVVGHAGDLAVEHLHVTPWGSRGKTRRLRRAAARRQEGEPCHDRSELRGRDEVLRSHGRCVTRNRPWADAPARTAASVE